MVDQVNLLMRRPILYNAERHSLRTTTKNH
jgi:hypothetical protein